MRAEEVASVLVTSLCDKLPSSIAALLGITPSATSSPVFNHVLSGSSTGSEDFADTHENNQEPSLEAFPYCVKTKYFTADIQFFPCHDPHELSDAKLASFEALIVFFDANCDNFKEKADLLHNLFTRCSNSAVNLAVCDLCDNEQIRRLFLDRLSDFELIETKADEQDECGLERLKEALMMHPWSNLVMHDSTRLPSNLRSSSQLFTGEKNPLQVLMRNGEAHKDASSRESEKQCLSYHQVSSAQSRNASDFPTAPILISSSDRDAALQGNVEKSFDRVSGDSHKSDTDELEFEELFAKLSSFKDHAMSLTGEERKKFAEDVATQFWKAMKLDDAELQGLDSESD